MKYINMKAIIFIMLIQITFCCDIYSQELMNESPKKIELKIKSKQGSVMKPGSVPITLEFKNASEKDTKLLDVFEPLPAFVSINIVKEDGTYVSLPGAGKVSFQRDDFKYIKIAKNSSYSKVIDIADVLSTYGKSFSKGSYKIKMAYHNQYGEDCIKGWIDSNQIEIEIE